MVNQGEMVRGEAYVPTGDGADAPGPKERAKEEAGEREIMSAERAKRNISFRLFGTYKKRGD